VVGHELKSQLMPPKCLALHPPPLLLYSDNSKKAFYKEFKRVVELSDVVIQVLDARDPLACRCPDVERYIRATNPNKKIVLLLNKMGAWGSENNQSLLDRASRRF